MIPGKHQVKSKHSTKRIELLFHIGECLPNLTNVNLCSYLKLSIKLFVSTVGHLKKNYYFLNIIDWSEVLMDQTAIYI